MIRLPALVTVCATVSMLKSASESTLCLASPPAPQQSADTGQKFVEGEGLYKVIVGPGIQSRDAVGDSIAGS